MTHYTLITGASGGIGEALAHEFAKHNQNVILLARNEVTLKNLKAKLISIYKIKAEVIVIDLTEDNATQRILDIIQTNHWHVDTLINNAGTGYHASFLESDYDRQMNMLKLNIEALVSLTYLLGQKMKEKGGGRILNISSLASLAPGPYMAVYYASKAFVSAFSEGLKEELKDTNITVTTLNPGPTETAFQVVSDLENSNMFKRLHVAPADKVAKVGYEALMKNKTKVYYGLNGKIMAILTKIIPTYITRKFTSLINRKPKEHH